jgi:hypothetical protein
VKYHHISAEFDRWIAYSINGVINRLPSFSRIRAKRPFFASIPSSFTYILQVAENIKAEKCNIVQISEESQFVPIIQRVVDPTRSKNDRQ